MLKTLVRLMVVGIVTASLGLSALPAAADGLGDVYEQIIVPGSNDAIKSALNELRAKREAQKRQAAAPVAATAPVAPSASLIPGTVAQVPPVSQQPVGQTVGFPTGFGYTADISMAYPYGNIGTYGKTWLMGGVDVSGSWAFNPSTRIVASMYQLQHYPYGFNSGIVPVYLQGFRNPVGCVDLGGSNTCGPGTGQNLNVRTKDTFGVFRMDKLFLLGGFLPIVVSPTYVARGGQIGASPVNNDQIPFAYNPPDGPVYTTLATRTAQYMAVALTLPFLKTPKMFGTFSFGPQWLVHTAGVNTKNAMQVPAIMYLEYTPTKYTTLWIEPQSARDYLPTDPYPEHLIAYFAGISQRITKFSFVQLVLNSGGPTNMGPDNVTAIKCLTVSVCAPAIGGLKATQLQLQFGFGSPGFFPL
jgi:hypothetical protein